MSVSVVLVLCSEGGLRAKMSKTKLRKDTDYFLVGQPQHSISGSKLPTLSAVLKYFFHVKKQSHANNTALRTVVDNVICFWDMARIPTQLPRNCVRKLKVIYEEWRELAKNKKRKGDPGDRKAAFKSKLDTLWDIAADDAIAQIRNNRLLRKEEREIDVKFYLDQKAERIGYMSGNDKVFAEAVRRREQRETGASSGELSAERQPDPATLSLASSTDTDIDSPAEPADAALAPGPAKRPRLDPSVTLTLPRRIMTAAPLLDVADR